VAPSTRSLHVVPDPLPIPSHCWVAAGLATAIGSMGAWFAVLLAMLDRATSVDLLSPPGVDTDQLGMPLSDLEYWWFRDGIWLFDLTVALGVVFGLLLTWRSLNARRLHACLFWAALTLGLSAVPLIINASRVA
jgi:hypothetical protein